MTPPPAGTPWWAWLLAVVLVAVISALAAHITQRPLRREVREVGASASHAATELTPNHGTSAKDQLGQLLVTVRAIDSRQGELAMSVGGLRDDLRLDRKTTGERFDRVDARLQEVEKRKGIPR